eukprot:gene25576-30882_t
MFEVEQESRSILNRILNILLTFILPSAKLHLKQHWALALVTWFFLIGSIMFAMLFYYFYNDCQSQFVDVDAKTFDAGLFTEPYSGNFLCGTYKSNLIPCVMPGLSCSDYGKGRESMCTGGVHCDSLLSCMCMDMQECPELLNSETIIPGANATVYITDSNTQMVYLVCPPIYSVIINAMQYTLFAKLVFIGVFLTIYLMKENIDQSGSLRPLFSAKVWQDIAISVFDESVPPARNCVHALKDPSQKDDDETYKAQSRLSRILPVDGAHESNASSLMPADDCAHETNAGSPAGPPVSPDGRQYSITEVKSIEITEEASPFVRVDEFANRIFQSMFPHTTIVIPSGVWSWSFILWMLASFFTMFIVLLMYFLFYDCTSGQTMVNAAFTDYRPDIYNEVFNTNNRHICSSRIYGALYELQDKVPYDCVLPGLTCKDYDTVFARGTCSSRHCDDSLPCINHVFEGVVDMDDPNYCSFAGCMVDVEYANCHSSYEAVMIAFQYTLLAKVAMASVFFMAYFLYHNGPFFLCEKATWLSFWACLNPSEPEEQGDAEKGQPAASAPQAAGYELVSMSPRAPIGSEPTKPEEQGGAEKGQPAASAPQAAGEPTKPEEQGDAEKGQPAASAPQAAGYELVSISTPAPIDSEPTEPMPEPKEPEQQHASDSGTWAAVTRGIQRAVDYVDQVLLATVIPLSRHQFHGRKSFVFLFWFVLASGAVFGSLLWYFLADCQVTSSIVDFAEADSTFREPSLDMCKSSTFLGVFDPCVYNEHHICGGSVKNRRETDCTEDSVDYVGYHAISGENICGILSSSAVFSCAIFSDSNCNPGSLDYIASYMPFWVGDDDGGGGVFNAGYVVPCVVKGMTCDDYGSFLPDKYCGTKICKNNRFCSQPIAAYYTGPIGSAEYYSCNTVSVAFIMAIQYTMIAQVAIVLLYFVHQRFAQYGVTAVTKKKFWNNLLELR